MPKRPVNIDRVRQHLDDDRQFGPSIPLDLLASIFPHTPEILFHYTTPHGLLGILSEGSIRATHIRYMNDYAEMTRGIDLVQAAYDHFREHNKSRVPRLLPLVKIRELCAALDVFAFCLSSRRDQLSQWRAYCGMGPGFAFGFDRRGLGELRTPHAGQSVIPVRIDYGEDAEGSMAYLDGIVRAAEEDNNLSSTYLRQTICDILVAEALKFKNPSFAEEGEWRFVVVQARRSVGTEFGVRRERIVPFLRLTPPESKLPIRELHLGPGSDTELDMSAAADLLRSNGYEKASVAVSGASYRP